MELSYDPEEEVSVVKVSFASTVTFVMERSKIVSLSNLISSVGGNLGLFVGFSVLTSLFTVYENLKKFLTRRYNNSND